MLPSQDSALPRTRAPSTRTEAPSRPVPEPVVVYAEVRRPLTGPELLARHGARRPVARARAMVPKPAPKVAPDEQPRRATWWPALALGTCGSLLLSACTMFL